MTRTLFQTLSLLLLLYAHELNAQTSASPASQQSAAAEIREKAQDWLSKTPVGFTENKGQLYDQYGKANPAVKYLLHMRGLNVQLRHTGFSYDAWIEKPGKDKDAAPVRTYHRVDIELEGADPQAQLVAEYPVQGSGTTVINSYGTFAGIQDYGKVTYKEIYPGIDLEFIAKQGSEKPVEYNFIVHPGADAGQIRMRYRNGSDITLRHGVIEMKLAFGVLKEKIPLSYTQQDRRSLAVQYKPLDEPQDLYAFNVPDYDHSKTLVIDPTPNLVWATYYGGNTSGSDFGNRTLDHPTDLTVDVAGNVVMTGVNLSATGMATSGVYLTAGDMNPAVFSIGDAYCVKFTSSGSRIWSTYVGTNNAAATTNNEVYPQVRTDAAGNVLLIMRTGAAAPTTSGALSTTRAGGADPYIMKLNPSGSSLLWGTYLGITTGGGTAPNRSFAFSVLASGDVLVGGTVGDPTSSLIGFGTGYQQTRPGGTSDAYLVKISGTNGSGVWGTYFGGAGTDAINDVSVDTAGNIYVTGVTTSTSGIATTGAYQTVYGGGANDAFLAKLNSNGSGVQWCTYYGGSGVDVGQRVSVNHQGNPVIGLTSSSSGLATTGTYQQTLGNALIAQFSASGSRTWATYYLNAVNASTITYTFTGALNHLLVDEQNNVYISGMSVPGSNAASSCSYQTTDADNDPYIAKLSNTGQRIWGTYYGVASTDPEGYNTIFPTYYLSGFTYAGSGNFYFAVATEGTNRATTGAFQTTRQGTWEGLLAKFNEGGTPADLATTASILSPTSQTSCILGVPAVITGNNVTYTTSATDYTSPVFYQWQSANSATGPWTNLVGEVFQNLQPASSSSTMYYRRLVQVSDTYCSKKTVDSSAVDTVIINANAAPVANADGPQWYVCGAPNDTITLNGSATGGTAPYTYQWFAGSSTTAATTTATYVPTPTVATTYTLRVADANGCTDIDQVTVMPVVANAGVDKSLCQGISGVQIGMPPIANPRITYSWTLANGAADTGTLSCTTCAQPIANPTVATSYVLTLTVTRKDNTTCSSTDTVTVTPVAAPNNLVAYAGSDKTICAGSNVTLGGASAGTGFTYTWSPATYLSSTTIYNPVFNSGSVSVDCSQTYLVTASKSGCSFTDQVTVTVVDPTITYQNDTLCGPVWIHQQTGTYNCPTATYSWSVVSGTGSVQQTADNGASAYLYSPSGSTVFRRTTTMNSVQCTADVIVAACGPGGTANCILDIHTISGHGCPKNFSSGASFQLATNLDSNNYTFSWSPASMVNNPTAATVTVTSTANAVITCVATNKFVSSVSCTDTIVVNDPNWSIPAFNFTDKNICAQTATNIGLTGVAGYTYQWSPATGLSSDTVANPLATLTGNHTYYVQVTNATTGCRLSDTIAVTAIPVIADAGNNRTVCNGGTVTLGTAAPVGTSFTYSWQPTGAAYTNGTSASDAQPQITFATSNQTFTLTVSDPVSGCTSFDTVTISSTVTTGEYAGNPPASVCPGGTVQLGRTAEPFASYNWTLANGSIATGLSCTSCANPVLTAPDSTTTYKVQISYPGCSLPVEDTVMVTVLPAPRFALSDKNYCPTTPIAIGFGASGNPSAPSGVSAYQWLPSTGLSNSLIANPITNTAVTRDYVVKVTYTNGCVRRDTITITPDAIADAGPDKSLCQGISSVQIGLPAISGATYSWSGGSFVGSSTVAQPTVNPSSTTTYTVSATSGSCTAIDTVQVYVNVPPDFDLTGATSICVGGAATVSLINAASPNSTWQWAPTTGVSDSTNPNTTILATDTTVYRLVQTSMVTGCSNYKDITIVVKPNPIAASVKDTSVCTGTVVALPLTITSTGSYQYVWTPPIGLSSAYIANPIDTIVANQTYAVTITDSATQCTWTDSMNVTTRPAIQCLPSVTLSGNVFRDRNALRDATVNSTSVLGIPTGLYVSLIDSTGSIVATTSVASNGTYSFNGIPTGVYRLVLHQNPSGSTTQSLPSGWMNTGENLNAGVGSDAAANGILIPITTLGVNVTNANFGIQQPPVSDTKSYQIDQPTVNMSIPLNGTHVSTGPGTSTPDQLTGSDPEDGIYDSSAHNSTVVISAAPDHGELWYNGALVNTGQRIVNYDPSLLSFKATGSGYTSATFSYAYVDSAGVESPAATYTLQWPLPLPVELLSFEAVKAGTAALLQWQTAVEQHIRQYSVERSTDGYHWTALSEVKAVGTGGYYHYTDQQPAYGLNYYRLSLVDYDGSYRLSPVRRLNFGSVAGAATIVPNPAHGTATVIFSEPTGEDIHLQLFNSMGQIIRNYQVPIGTTRYELSLRDMAKGPYYLHVEGSADQSHLKLIIQ
jgi:hypothetical protein